MWNGASESDVRILRWNRSGHILLWKHFDEGSEWLVDGELERGRQFRQALGDDGDTSVVLVHFEERELARMLCLKLDAPAGL